MCDITGHLQHLPGPDVEEQEQGQVPLQRHGTDGKVLQSKELQAWQYLLLSPSIFK